MEQFTYGFEIEGLFDKTVIKKLSRLKCDCEVKRDGSVDTWRIIMDNHVSTEYIYGNGSQEYTEFNVGVFQNKKDLFEALSCFVNGTTYFMDKSCGLHLHIKPKESELKELFWDLDFIKDLEKFAYTELCPCVKSREKNNYCKKYGSFDDFYQDHKHQEKYRFVRNHPSGTMEFRFFAPCEHKEDNVKKFLAYMEELLAKQEHKKTASIILEDFNTIELEDQCYVLAEQKNEDYSYILNNSI
jgi:hypothetical protein